MIQKGLRFVSTRSSMIQKSKLRRLIKDIKEQCNVIEGKESGKTNTNNVLINADIASVGI